MPDTVALADFGRTGTRADVGAAIGGIARIQRHETRVVDKAIGIFKAFDIAAGHQRTADRIGGEIDRARGRQEMAPADVVIEKQPEPEQPGRPQPGVVRQHESERTDDVGGDLPKDFALDQCLAHQAKLVIFEIA